MQVPRAVWLGSIGCAMVVSSFLMFPRMQHPPTSMSLRTPVNGAAASGPSFSETSSRLPTAFPRAERAEIDHSMLALQRYWQDPSIDPKVLERAYAPAPKRLPPEARPNRSAIEPPAKEWRRLQREDDAIAY
jgi:hypothetical protein